MKHLPIGIVALFAATSQLVSIETAADTWIEQFIFKCEVPSEEIRFEDVRAGVFSYSETGHVIPRDGKIGAMFYSDVRYYREDCRDEIDRSIVQCNQNNLFLSPPFDPTSETDADELDKPIHRRCVPIFERQRKQCVEHFKRERAKCNAGSDDVNREAHASDTRPVENDARDTGEDGSSAGDAWKPWEDNADSEAGEDEHWVSVADLNEGYEPDDGDYDECKDVRDDCPVDTYWTEEQQEGARQIELWVNFADPQANAGTGPEDEGWEHEKYDVAVENGDAAYSDDVNREAPASDTGPVENDARDTGEDGSSEGDGWKPWQDEAASDAGEDEHWVDIADPNEEYEPDDGDYGECKDVWADCPVDTYWTKEQQEGARQIELWVNFADPNANAETGPEAEGWRNEAYDATSENRDAADSASEVFERALAGLLNEDGSSTAHLYSAPDEDYLAVLTKMDAQTKEEARIEAENSADEAAVNGSESTVSDSSALSDTSKGPAEGEAGAPHIPVDAIHCVKIRETQEPFSEDFFPDGSLAHKLDYQQRYYENVCNEPIILRTRYFSYQNDPGEGYVLDRIFPGRYGSDTYDYATIIVIDNVGIEPIGEYAGLPEIAYCAEFVDTDITPEYLYDERYRLHEGSGFVSYSGVVDHLRGQGIKVGPQMRTYYDTYFDSLEHSPCYAEIVREPPIDYEHFPPLDKYEVSRMSTFVMFHTLGGGFVALSFDEESDLGGVTFRDVGGTDTHYISDLPKPSVGRN